MERAAVLLASTIAALVRKWSILVPECMVVKPGKTPGSFLEPGVLPGSIRLSGIQYLTVSTT